MDSLGKMSGHGVLIFKTARWNWWNQEVPGSLVLGREQSRREMSNTEMETVGQGKASSTPRHQVSRWKSEGFATTKEGKEAAGAGGAAQNSPGSSHDYSAGACYGAWPSKAPWPLAVAQSRLCPREMTVPWALQNSWTTWDNSEGLHFRTQVSTNCGRQSISILAGPVQTAVSQASELTSWT